MTQKEIKKPTKADLAKALKDYHKLDIKAKDIDADMFAKAIKGYDRGLSLRSMSARLKYELAGGARDSEKERIPVTGIFTGSRDFVSEKKPLGKNKTQLLSFIQEKDDGSLELFTNPNSPSHFKGFDKSVFGKKVNCSMLLTVNNEVTYVAPHDIEVINEDYTIDTGLLKVYDAEGADALDDYTPCMIAAEITSIWPLKVPNWDQDKYDDEDFPFWMKNNPVFQMYLKPIGADDEENDLVIRANVNPVHLGKPFIQMEDWDILANEDVEDIEEEISAAFSGRQVVLVGQKQKSTEYDDKRYVEYVVDAILEIDEMPEIIKPSKKKGKGKAPEKKKEKTAEEKEQAKLKIRQEKVAETVTAMMEETTTDIVRSMHDEKYFIDMSDEDLQALIDAEFEEQGIESEEETGDEGFEDEQTEDDEEICTECGNVLSQCECVDESEDDEESEESDEDDEDEDDDEEAFQ